MKLRKVLKIAIGLLFSAMVLAYLWALIANFDDGLEMAGLPDMNTYRTIAVFGATGTIGDGLLKAAIADPDVEKIHVITRRPSPRIEAGVASGKVVMTKHMDYLDYGSVIDALAEVDTVFWAIGISAVGLEQEAYCEIHLDFPMRFVEEWLPVSRRDEIAFHYVSGAGTSADSRMMWAREKARAERELTEFASGTKMRVISYRPGGIMPTEAEAHFGHRILNAIFSPIHWMIEAEGIGRAMLEATARKDQFGNGTILENTDILSLDKAYQSRRGAD